MWNAASGPAAVIEIVAPGGRRAIRRKLAPILADHRTAAEYYKLARTTESRSRTTVSRAGKAYGVKAL